MMFKTLFAVNCCKWVQTHRLKKNLTRQAYKRNKFKFHSLQTWFLGNFEVFKDCEKKFKSHLYFRSQITPHADS